MNPSTNYADGAYLLQIELSTVCNALCLGCVRIDHRNFTRTKPTIPKGKYLDINLLLGIFDTEAGKNIKRLEFCGTIDEPLAHPQFIPLLEKLYEKRPDLRISIHTNGGQGSPEDFTRISELLLKFDRGSHFRFSIDGLEDTNHIYRQNVKWNKVQPNLLATLAVGAPVIWQFLVFPWNRHQTDEAHKLAKEWGCAEFWVRPDRSLASNMGLEQIQARQKNPKKEGRSAGGLSDLRAYGRLVGHDIKCSFKEMGMLFLNWEGKVWPCCYHSNISYESPYKKQLFEKLVTQRYEENFNNLHQHSFDQILSSPFFQNDLMESWGQGGRQNKMSFRCVERCSVAKTRSSDAKPDDRTFYSQTIFRDMFT